MKAREKIDLDFCEITMYDNGIFHVHHKGRMALTLEQAKKIAAVRCELTNNQPCLVLSTSSGSFNMPTKEATKYYQSKDRTKSTLACAYVITTFPQRLAIKALFFLQKTKFPSAGFQTFENAAEWLLEQKKKQNK